MDTVLLDTVYRIISELKNPLIKSVNAIHKHNKKATHFEDTIDNYDEIGKIKLLDKFTKLLEKEIWQ